MPLSHDKRAEGAVLVPKAKSEAEIMATWKTHGVPCVSICCATFNHANYLDDALAGFLCQETDFPFEIIIRDDASADGTAEIALRYASLYPQIVRAVIETENQFSKGVRPMHRWPILARGEFIALCEGDDFWVSPLKLQKQVDLLSKHPQAVMAVGETAVCQQVGDDLVYLGSHSGNGRELQYFEDVKHEYFHTSTYLIRAGILNDLVIKYFGGQTVLGDTALRFILVSCGPFAMLPEVVSVYRQTGEGIWTSLAYDKRLEWELASTRRLVELLVGDYKIYQGERLFFLLSVSLFRSLKARKLVSALRILPEIFKYGVKYKLAGYGLRKWLVVSRLFHGG